MKRILYPAILLLLAVAVTSCDHGPLVLDRDNVDEVISALTLEEKVHLLLGTSTTDSVSKAVHGRVPGAAGTTYPVERLGIPALVLSDGPNGVNVDEYATCFPAATLLASTWNENLAIEEGAAIGEEALAKGIDVLLGPAANIHRNPLNGRNFEYYSEDPYVSGIMAAAYIYGLQSRGVAACLKHFAVNNQELNRLSNDTRASERTLREIYLRGFNIAVRRGGPWTIMSSYNRVNGNYVCESREFLTDLLRKEWRYRGLVMSDWGAGIDNAAMIAAGNDNIQPGSDERYEALLAAVREGRLSEEDVDLSVKRLLNTILRIRNFRKSDMPDSLGDGQSHLELARRIAGEGIVLLKNDGKALPLDPCDVAVFGSAAYDWTAMGGGAGDVNCEYRTGIIEGLRDAGFTLDKTADEAYSVFMQDEGGRTAQLRKEAGHWRRAAIRPRQIENLSDIVAGSIGNGAKAAVIVIGRQSNEGIDRLVVDDFNLTADELSMIHTVSEAYHSAGRKVVVVLNTCCAVEMASWRDCADAIVEAWLPGQTGGLALADIISGKVSPSGHLAMTIPMKYSDVPSADNFPVVEISDGRNPSFHRFSEKPLREQKNIDYTNYEEGIMVGYRHYTTRNVDTAYPFGYGLSYTTFEWSDMQIERKNRGWAAVCRVTNTGKVPGKDVVQLYVTAPKDAGIEMPSRELRGFAKTSLLAPGQSEKVSIYLTVSDIASYYEDLKAWVTMPGNYVFRLARHSEDNGMTGVVTMTKPVGRKTRSQLAPEGDVFISTGQIY